MHVMTLLRHGVPITLLADLLAEDGPRSREILTAEAVSGDVSLDDAGLRSAASSSMRTSRAGGVAGDFSGAEAAC